MNSPSVIVKGTVILTLTGFITRFLGFFYRIFLSRTFGEEGMGLYQLIFPIYALVLSFTCAGIQTALSRTTAKYVALKKEEDAKSTLKISLFLTLLLSFLSIVFIQTYAKTIANIFLHESRCENLLILLSYAFPFGALHSCICGYYLGYKNTLIPSVSLLIEQLFRIGTVYCIYHFVCIEGQLPDIKIIIIGLIAGEASSTIFCLCALKRNPIFSNVSFRKAIHLLRNLITLSVPLTANRVFLNILQSIEAISIPVYLNRFGLPTEVSLSTYGVLTGMTLPCILFPSAITNSIASMLIPVIAELQATKNRTKLIQTIKKVGICCFLLGSVCCILLLIFGAFIGNHIFHSQSAGDFIITLAWICPFLYTNSNFISILNGLGKANYTLLYNIISLSIRIFSVFFLIPAYGIQGYLWGLLVGQLLLFLLCSLHLYRFCQ